MLTFFILISNAGFVAAPLEGKSIEQLLQESDIIMLGTIVSVHEIPSEKMTQYEIKPDEYLKPSNYVETEKNIIAQSPGTKNSSLLYFRTYDMGDHALFFLEKQGVDYDISPYSYVTKSNCSAAQLLSIAGFTSDLSSVSHVNHDGKFYTNEPINVTAYAGNGPDLQPKDTEIKFRVYTPTGNVVTETRHLHMEECAGFVKSSWSFTPTIPGTYSVRVTWYEKNETFSGETMSSFPIVNSDGSSSVSNIIPASKVIANKTDVLIDIPKGSSQIGCETNGSCYRPGNVIVVQGTKVTWHNDDVMAHTVTSGKPSDDLTGTVFDSNLIPSGQSFEFVFRDIGSYHYYCQLHPWMTGIVTVTSNSQTLNMTSTGSSLQEPQNKSYLQEQLDIGKRPITFNQKQSEDMQNIFYVVITGISIFVIISTLLFWFTRK